MRYKKFQLLYYYKKTVTLYLRSTDCFTILDHASSNIQLKVKESNRSVWEKPSLVDHQKFDVFLSVIS